MGTPGSPKKLSDLDPDIVAFSNAPALLAQTAPFFSIAALVVIGRCYVRIAMLRAFGRDDWAMLLAMVSTRYQSRFSSQIGADEKISSWQQPVVSQATQ